MNKERKKKERNMHPNWLENVMKCTIMKKTKTNKKTCI
jgi:hypothetical protein